MFILCDIKHFYPTVTTEPLSKSLGFAKTKLQISGDDKKNKISFKKIVPIWQRKHNDEEREGFTWSNSGDL